jgi:hypothetical protein
VLLRLGETANDPVVAAVVVEAVAEETLEMDDSVLLHRHHHDRLADQKTLLVRKQTMNKIDKDVEEARKE